MELPDDWYEDHDGQSRVLNVAKVESEIDRLRTQRNEKTKEIAGWKRTALAMRDEAIYWLRDGKSRYDDIERLYFDAAMLNKFAPGDAFGNEQDVKK